MLGQGQDAPEFNLMAPVKGNAIVHVDDDGDDDDTQE